MKLFLRRNAPLFYALAAMLVLYIPWLNRGFNNYEFPFLFAGRALAFDADAALIDIYWPNMANPLGYSFILSLIYRSFGFSDSFWISRFPAMVGVALIIISGWLITKSSWEHKRHLFYCWCTLLIFQPMIFVFSTSGTTDLLPVGILMLSISFAMSSKRNFLVVRLFVGLLFGFAVLVKYNTAYFGLALVATSIYNSWSLDKSFYQKIRALVPFIIVPGLVLCSYLFWCYERYGILISSRLEFSRPNYFDISNILKNFVKYLSFLGLLLAALPLTVFLGESNGARPKVSRSLGLLSFGVFLVGWYYSGVSAGELDFGRFIDPIHPLIRRVLESIGAVFGFFALLVMFRSTKFGYKIMNVLLFGIVPYLILISASYPSQRYLTFVLPGSLLILINEIQSLTKRTQTVIIGLSTTVFALVSLLGMSYLTSQGNASEEMAVWVEDNNLIGQTSAGAIGPHAGQHFWGVEKTVVRYEIIAVAPSAEAQVKERILHREPMKVLGRVTRVYLLREIPAAP